MYSLIVLALLSQWPDQPRDAQPRKTAGVITAIQLAGGTVDEEIRNGQRWYRVNLDGVADVKLAISAAIDLPNKISLSLRELRLTRRDLQEVSRMQELEELELPSAKLEHGSLAAIGKMRKLKGLGLGGVRLSDADMEHLSELSELEFINLAETQISRNGIQHIARMKRLVYIGLDFNLDFSDSSLDCFKELCHLRSLLVNGANVSAKGISKLCKTSLEDLTIRSTTLHQGDIPILQSFPKLTRLTLISPGLRDDCLVELARLKNLKRLYLIDTEITEEGALRLARTLRDTNVYRHRSDGTQPSAIFVGSDEE